MNFLTLILSVFVVISSPQDDPHAFWNRVLEKYEQLCDACLDHRPTKDINGLTKDLNEMLKHPVGKMDSVQQQRFVQIQNRYKGIITVNTLPQKTQSSRIIKVDTVRRVEYVKVVDTVFVKEVLGAIEINQKISNNDTIVHIIQYQPAVPVPPSVPVVQEEQSVTIPKTPDISPARTRRIPSCFALGLAGVIPDASFGVMAGAVDKWGFYANCRFRTSGIASDYSCSPEGVTPSGRIWTNGSTDYSRLTCSAGGGYDLWERVFVYAGAGYGSYDLLWQDIDGRWAKVSGASCRGVNLDAGILLHFGHIAVTAESCWTAFNYWDMSVGLGFWF